jgi:predicted PurR-regulated permease PerM
VKLIPWVQESFGISVPDLIRQRTSQIADEAAALLQEAGPAMARMLASFASNTARVIVTILGLLVVPVIAFFFLTDYPAIVGRFKGLIPRQAVGLISRRFAEVDEVLSSFIRGQLTVGAILSVIYSTGLSFARLEMAIVIGLVTGFGNMVPYVGTTLGILLSLTAVVLSWQGPWQLAVIAGTFLTAQLLEGLVITPRVVGHRVGLTPVAVIIAILAFAELFDFLGVLLAVPTTAVLKVVVQVLLSRYRKTRLYLGEQKA